MNLLDRAVKLAAEQDEPDDMNFVRKHAKEQVRRGGNVACIYAVTCRRQGVENSC